MALPTISGEFRIVGEPELRFTPSGQAVWKARCVASKQKKDDDGKWVDDKTLWANVSVWRDMAENAVESLTDKDLITVVGEIATTNYETANGEKRTSVDITAFSIGTALRFRKTPHGAQQQQQAQPQQQQQYPPQQQQYPQQQQQYAQQQPQYAQQQGGYPPQQQQYPPQQQQQQAWPPAASPNDPPF